MGLITAINEKKDEAKPVTFEGGAMRSEVKPRYDLITPEFLQVVGDALGEGVKRGEFNWTKGNRAFAIDTFNHLIEHLYKFRDGDRKEDHLGHAAANVMFLVHFAKNNPEWFEKGAA